MTCPPAAWCGAVVVLLALTMDPSPAFAQAAPEPPAPLLGRGHLWLEAGKADLDGAAAGVWGVDHEGYLGLEGYHGSAREFYFGAELGRAGAGEAVNKDGDTIRDFDFLWLELNGKKAFRLGHGFTIDVGLGSALFYVDGEEVSMGTPAFTDPLADFGFGAQVFFDLNWRARDLLLGIDAKYQWAFDIINVDYSNLRLGIHLGVAF